MHHAVKMANIVGPELSFLPLEIVEMIAIAITEKYALLPFRCTSHRFNRVLTPIIKKYVWPVLKYHFNLAQRGYKVETTTTGSPHLFAGMHTLTVNNNEHGVEKTLDVRPLENIDTLTLYWTGTVDISPLYRVRDLTVTGIYCRAIYALTNVQILRVKRCKELTNISDMAGLKELYISQCDTLCTLGDLPNVEIMEMANCPRGFVIRGFPKLRTISVINSGLCHIQNLPKMILLNISRCPRLEEISNLSNIETIRVQDCWRLQYLHHVDAVRYLTLRSCRITNLPELPLLEFVDLKETPIVDVSQCLHATKADFSHTKVKDVSMFCNLEWLSVKETEVIEIPMDGLKVLDISRTSITDVAGMTKLHKLTMKGTKVKDISMLRDVLIVV